MTTTSQSIKTDQAKPRIIGPAYYVLGNVIIDGITGKIIVGGNEEIVLDAVTKMITVGGSYNGQIVVKDSSGNTKITLDNTGITVESGKLTIKDENGTTVLDSKGLVSTANFLADTVYKTTNQTIDGDDGWVDVTQLTLNFTTARQVKVLFSAYLTMEHQEIDQTLFGRFVLDGNAIGPTFQGGMHWYLGTYGSSFVYSVPAGAHTIKIQVDAILAGTLGYVRGADNTNGCVLSYVILGN